MLSLRWHLIRNFSCLVLGENFVLIKHIAFYGNYIRNLKLLLTSPIDSRWEEVNKILIYIASQGNFFFAILHISLYRFSLIFEHDITYIHKYCLICKTQNYFTLFFSLFSFDIIIHIILCTFFSHTSSVMCNLLQVYISICLQRYGICRVRNYRRIQYLIISHIYRERGFTWNSRCRRLSEIYHSSTYSERESYQEDLIFFPLSFIKMSLNMINNCHSE